MQSFINNLLLDDIQANSGRNARLFNRYGRSDHYNNNNLNNLNELYDCDDDLDAECGIGAGRQNVFSSRMRRSGLGGFGAQQQWQQQQQQQQQQQWQQQLCDDADYYDDCAYTTRFGRSQGRVGANRFGANQFDLDDECDVGFGRNLGRNQGTQGTQAKAIRAIKRNVLNNLVQDREKDAYQNEAIKHLINNRRYNRNKVGVIQALISGQNVSKNQIAQLLAEDFVADRVSDNIILRLLKDDQLNRNTDNIIYDIANGIPHWPAPPQAQEFIQQKNDMCRNFVNRCVKTVCNPNFAKRVVNSGAVLRMLENTQQNNQQNQNQNLQNLQNLECEYEGGAF